MAAKQTHPASKKGTSPVKTLLVLAGTALGAAYLLRENDPVTPEAKATRMIEFVKE